MNRDELAMLTSVWKLDDAEKRAALINLVEALEEFFGDAVVDETLVQGLRRIAEASENPDAGRMLRLAEAWLGFIRA